jgi:glutamate racemase
MSRLDAPIGVFDSGLGGLTVARQLREKLPQERLLYVADQAHVPYGGRPLAEVKGFALGISAALRDAECKAIVMACNISSAVALPSVQAEWADLPVMGVILPGARAALTRTRTGRIGVLATTGTVQSGAYTRSLKSCDSGLYVREIACPAFVPLVEAGNLETSDAVAAAIEYLAPLCAVDVDTIILGCTHYPFLLPVLRRVAPHLRYIDPAEATVEAMARELSQRKLLAPRSEAAMLPDLLTTTGDVAVFSDQLRRFLPDTDVTVAEASWEGGTLTLP